MVQKNDFSDSAKYYDIILGKENFKKNAKFVAKELRKLNVKTILELACGTGLYLSPLKKSGFNIDGLDVSEEMLRIARKNNKGTRLYKQDMSKFKTNRKYDAILILNSSLVLLPDFSLVKETLNRCYKHLNKKGILMLDLPNHAEEIKELNLSQDHAVYKIPNGKIDVIFRNYKKNNKWVAEWYGFVSQENSFSYFSEHYEELIYSSKRLENSLKNLGFKILKIFGSRRGGKFYKNKSYRRFYICQKV